MKIQSYIASVIFSALILNIALQCFADTARPSVKSQSQSEETPNITNEAEYAEFVRKREGAGQTSSVRSTRLKKSSASTKFSLSSAASSSQSKTSGN